MFCSFLLTFLPISCSFILSLKFLFMLLFIFSFNILLITLPNNARAITNDNTLAHSLARYLADTSGSPFYSFSCSLRMLLLLVIFLLIGIYYIIYFCCSSFYIRADLLLILLLQLIYPWLVHAVVHVLANSLALALTLVKQWLLLMSLSSYLLILVLMLFCKLVRLLLIRSEEKK